MKGCVSFYCAVGQSWQSWSIAHLAPEHADILLGDSNELSHLSTISKQAVVRVAVEMNDANSVYVGGLSYESSEDTVKKAFMEFGEVVSVKIVYDRESGESRGFGFVSFTNPRSATMAIRDMDGGQIEGRTIRVNEVRKNLKGLGFRDRDRDFRSRDMRERIRRRGSPPFRERVHHRTRSPPPERSRSPTPVRSSPAGRESCPRRGSSPIASAGRYQSPELKERDRDRSRSGRSSVSPQSSDRNERKEESVHKGDSKISSRIATIDKDEDDVRRLKEDLESAEESRRALEEKVASLKGVVEKANVTIAALKNKAQKLEESLTSAQQLAAHRQFQLKRLQTGVFQYKLCTERLSNSEKEMKALVALTSLEVDHDPRSTHNNAAAAAAPLEEPQAPPPLANGDEPSHHRDAPHPNSIPAWWFMALTQFVASLESIKQSMQTTGTESRRRGIPLALPLPRTRGSALGPFSKIRIPSRPWEWLQPWSLECRPLTWWFLNSQAINLPWFLEGGGGFLWWVPGGLFKRWGFISYQATGHDFLFINRISVSVYQVGFRKKIKK